MKSPLFKLKGKDFAKSIAMFVITTLGASVYKTVVTSGIPSNTHDLVQILGTAGLAAGSYLFKSFITNSKDELLTKEIHLNGTN